MPTESGLLIFRVKHEYMFMSHQTENITGTYIHARRIVKRSGTRGRLEIPWDNGTTNAISVQLEHKLLQIVPNTSILTRICNTLPAYTYLATAADSRQSTVQSTNAAHKRRRHLFMESTGWGCLAILWVTPPTG